MFIKYKSKNWFKIYDFLKIKLTIVSLIWLEREKYMLSFGNNMIL